MNDPEDEEFFACLAPFEDFEGVMDDRHYRPVPEDWFLAMADVVGSTQAIRQGRYKDVNLAGASVISAVINAVGKGDYPFVFGGDGAMLALPKALETEVRAALAAVRAWVHRELKLELRTAIIPIADIRNEGADVKLARYMPNDHVSYAMFSGGGAAWAEKEMKAGNYLIEAGVPELRPDLTGLSCRWQGMNAVNGKVVSIVVLPAAAGTEREFAQLIAQLTEITRGDGRGSHPVPAEGPPLRVSMQSVLRETRMAMRVSQRPMRFVSIMLQVGLTAFLHWRNIRLGKFDARRYRREVAANSDFRKFDDGLKMTVDIDEARLARVEQILADAEQGGIARCGLHAQDSAVITCFVPTPLAQDHIHFIDGGSGGYAMAASQVGRPWIGPNAPAS